MGSGRKRNARSRMKLDEETGMPRERNRRMALDEETGMPAERRRRRRSGIGCFGTLVLIVLILLVALVFAVRTHGALELMSDYLRNRTGLDVTIGSARIGLPCDLILEDVNSVTNGGGRLRVAEVRMGLRWTGSMPVRIRGADVEFQRTPAGRWEPETFERVAALSDVRETARIFNGMPRRMVVEVRDSRVSWKSTNGVETASAQGVHFTAACLDTAWDTLLYCNLFASDVTRPGGGRGRAIRRIWVCSDRNPYAELEYSGSWENGEGAAADWWSRPPPAATGERSGK